MLWILVSIPVYFAGKVVKGRDAHFGEAMTATLGGVVVFFIVYLVAALALGVVLGPPAGVFALLLGFLGWLAVFKGSFQTTWLGAVGIVVLSWIILMVLDLALVAVFGIALPSFYPF